MTPVAWAIPGFCHIVPLCLTRRVCAGVLKHNRGTLIVVDRDRFSVDHAGFSATGGNVGEFHWRTVQSMNLRTILWSLGKEDHNRTETQNNDRVCHEVRVEEMPMNHVDNHIHHKHGGKEKEHAYHP